MNAQTVQNTYYIGNEYLTMEQIADAVTDLLTVDAGGRGVIGELSEAAHTYHGRSPILEAAERLTESVSSGDTVFIVTGFLCPPTATQETDGPVGAASLARAIKLGLDAHPILMAEEESLPMIESAARSYGLDVGEPAAVRDGDWSCSVTAIPTDTDEANTFAGEMIDTYDPAATIAIERAGANVNNEYYSMSATNITDESAKAERLFELTNGVTIGIGDGGNEIGMGAIEETVREEVPHAAMGGAACGGGIAAVSATDVIVPITVSNWGGHGISAVLSVLLDTPVLHDPELEQRALVQCGLAGGIDGPTGKTTGASDGLSASAHASVIELLHEIISESSF